MLSFVVCLLNLERHPLEDHVRLLDNPDIDTHTPQHYLNCVCSQQVTATLYFPECVIVYC